MSNSGSEVLHILRNPYSWTEEDQRQARLKAADLIEAQAKEIAALRADAERADRAEKVLRRISNMFGNEDRTNRECCEPAFRYFNPTDDASEVKP